MSELLALAKRCEKAEGPDRELDGFVYVAHSRAFSDRPVSVQERAGYMRFTFDDGDHWSCPSSDVPAYTGSLDAAMSLVPEGWQKSLWIGDSDNGTDALCELCAYEFDGEIQVRAKTWPLALCAASLRALSSMETPRG